MFWPRWWDCFFSSLASGHWRWPCGQAQPCAEVATSMLLTTLRDLGAGTPPDRILYGTLVFFVGVRSLVFAAVFWGGLKLTGIGRVAAQSQQLKSSAR